MSDIDWEWQKIRLENDLMKVDGDAFETRFQEIAKALWGHDFQASIPMGSRGDLKCDGYRQSTGTVYQCFGPRYGQVNVPDALAKIADDFGGATAHWGALMKEWFFVVNVYRDKIPAELIQAIAQIEVSTGVNARLLNRTDIMDVAKALGAPKRKELWGHAPLPAEMVRITYEYIGRALAAVKDGLEHNPLTPIALPSAVVDKINWNNLGPGAKRLLTVGQTGADRVRHYLMNQVDPASAEEMAQGFVARYKSCRADGYDPDEIFRQMVIFAGGATGDPDRECAALAIVTHFFTTCEIFERPPETSEA
jgi:hypothetical protein